MLSYESQRKAIVIFILAVILVIILSVVSLIFIWIPEEEEKEPEYEVGEIDNYTFKEKDVVNRYYNELYLLFLNSDVDGIYDLVSKDYLQFSGFDKDKLKNYLNEKGVLGKNLELNQYEANLIVGYNKVYSLDLKAKEEAYSINIVVKESSPGKYTISFDKFIDVNKDIYDTTLESVRLKIDQRIRYLNTVEYRFEITNSYDKNIKINSGAKAVPVILVNNNQQSRKPIMSTISTAEITLMPKETKTVTAIFNMNDMFDHAKYNMLVLKNIEYDGINGTSNIEYTIK